MSITDYKPTEIKHWIKDSWVSMRESRTNFMIGVLIIIVFAVIVGGFIKTTFFNAPAKTESKISYFTGPVFNGSVFFNSLTTTTPIVSGEFSVDPNGPRTTLSSVFNLSPVIFRPAGPTTTFVGMHGTSTLGVDGLYQTRLYLNILTLPNIKIPILHSVSSSVSVICSDAVLTKTGVLLGGENTGRTAYEYVMDCSSQKEIVGNEEFLLNWTTTSPQY